MAPQTPQKSSSALWRLAASQHGVVTRTQLLDQGFSSDAIKHRIAKGRLHPVWCGVYAVGRPQITPHGRWMAAVLSCGPKAVLSHHSAAALWEIAKQPQPEIHVTAPTDRRRPGFVVHRRARPSPGSTARCCGIPVTNPAQTLVDLASRIEAGQLEAAVNEADRRDLINPEQLRWALDEMVGRPGVALLRKTLDRRTFTLTDSELERRFLPIARRAGLPPGETGRYVNGFKVDFYWPSLGLVVETDGLRYHRTPAQQARDRLRDQTHAAAGLTPMRFTRAQVRFEPAHVESTLAAVADRLR